MKSRILCVVILLAVASCHTNDTDNRLLEEEQKLAQYIANNKSELTLTNGIYFEKTNETDGVKAEAGDYVLVDYVCKYLYDETVEQVSYKDYQEYAALFPSNYKEGGPEIWYLRNPLYGLSVGLAEMHEGESANLYVPSRHSLFMDFITRLYEITMIKVVGSDIKAYQEELMGDYFKRYYQGAADTISIKLSDNKEYRIMYHIVSEGTGKKIEGTVVQTTTSESFILSNTKEPQPCFESMEKEWPVSGYLRNIFNKMQINGRVVVLMPYKIVYGEQNYTNGYAQLIAPAESVLLYHIEIK